MDEANVNINNVVSGIRNIMEDLGLNYTNMAKLVGVDVSNFSKKMKKSLAFSPRDFRKFSAANISVDYLKTLEGPMYTGPVNSNTESDFQEGVPVFDEEFGCGYAFFSDPSTKPIGYASLPGTKGATCWCKATGKSMEPKIENGDYVCLKKVMDWKDFIVYGDIYAIDCVNDMRTIKRVEKGGDDTEFNLVPDNKDYNKQSIKKDVIRNLFRVVSVSKAL